MGVVEGILSLFGGGLTGLLGAGLQKVFDYKAEQLKAEVAKDQRAHELALKHADAAIMQQEWAQRVKVAETESAGKVAEAETQAFASSFNLEPKQYSAGVAPTPAQAWLLVILDFIRGSIRPGLTIYLCVLTTMIYVHARSISGGIPAADALPIVKEIIQTILYTSSATIMWWFGLRGGSKK